MPTLWISPRRVCAQSERNTTTRARSYAYDAASQMTTQTIDGIATTYGYDSAGQLASEARTGYSASYTYDGNGNRLTKTLNGTTENYSYDDGDKLLDIKVSGVAVKTLSYDAAGRTTQIATSAYTRNFSYDYEDRITQITGLPTTNNFTYNGFDTRTKKVDSAGTANFKRLGAGVTAPVVDDGSATYTPGISERRSGTTTYLHAGLKTLDQRTNSSQANTGTKRYDAFGNVVSSTDSWASPWGYAGKFGYQSGEDAELMLLGHRYYDASTGRFLSRDPFKDGRNWYGYCGGTPTTWLDPMGMDRIIVHVNKGGFGLGSHAIIGLEDSYGKRQWFGFYPGEDESEGRRRSSGRSLSGPGFVAIDRPDSDGKESEIIVDATDRRKVLRHILRDRALYLKGEGEGYSFTGNNCAAWIAKVLGTELGLVFPNPKQPEAVRKALEGAE